MNDRYYVGEHVLIKANYGNPSVVHTNNVTWKKKTDTGTYLIDKKSPRLSVTSDRLEISSCRESDVGTYFLSVDCRKNFSIKSNKIHLKVVKGKIVFSLYNKHLYIISLSTLYSKLGKSCERTTSRS